MQTAVFFSPCHGEPNGGKWQASKLTAKAETAEHFGAKPGYPGYAQSKRPAMVHGWCLKKNKKKSPRYRKRE